MVRWLWLASGVLLMCALVAASTADARQDTTRGRSGTSAIARMTDDSNHEDDHSGRGRGGGENERRGKAKRLRNGPHLPKPASLASR